MTSSGWSVALAVTRPNLAVSITALSRASSLRRVSGVTRKGPEAEAAANASYVRTSHVMPTRLQL